MKFNERRGDEEGREGERMIKESCKSLIRASNNKISPALLSLTHLYQPTLKKPIDNALHPFQFPR